MEKAEKSLGERIDEIMAKAIAEAYRLGSVQEKERQESRVSTDKTSDQ